MPNGPDSPERLADLLSQFLKRTGMDARIKQSAVLEQWPTLVGPEIAGATQALSITDDGTLFVAVRSHAWMSELTMMERELLASVNRITGDKPILKLRWTLMRLARESGQAAGGAPARRARGKSRVGGCR